MTSVPNSGVRVALQAALIVASSVAVTGCAQFFEPEPQVYGSLKDPPAARSASRTSAPVRRVAAASSPRVVAKPMAEPAPSAKVVVEATPAPAPAPAPAVVAAPKAVVAEPRTETTATSTLSSAPVVVQKAEPPVVEIKPVTPSEPAKTEPMKSEPITTGSTTAAPQQVAVATPVSREENDDSKRLVTEGRQLFLSGKVVEARRRFITAMSGSVDALLALARSYDLNYLSDLQTSDAGPDHQRAVSLYQRAAAQGSVEAKGDLDRIAASVKAKP